MGTNKGLKPILEFIEFGFVIKTLILCFPNFYWILLNFLLINFQFPLCHLAQSFFIHPISVSIVPFTWRLNSFIQSNTQAVLTIFILIDDRIQRQYDVFLRAWGLEDIWQLGVKGVIVKGSEDLFLAVWDICEAGCGDLNGEVVDSEGEVEDSWLLWFARKGRLLGFL